MTLDSFVEYEYPVEGKMRIFSISFLSVATTITKIKLIFGNGNLWINLLTFGFESLLEGTDVMKRFPEWHRSV